MPISRGSPKRNAGVGASSPLGSISEEQFDFIFGVNAKGVLFTVQGALRRLTEGGTVVIIGSTASTKAEYGMSLYGGSKAAIRQFIRGWISEVKERGVRINVLSPGAIDTPSLRTALVGASGEENVEREVKRMREGNPLGLRQAIEDDLAQRRFCCLGSHYESEPLNGGGARADAAEGSSERRANREEPLPGTVDRAR